jgi:hypothetical protein
MVMMRIIALQPEVQVRSLIVEVATGEKEKRKKVGEHLNNNNGREEEVDKEILEEDAKAEVVEEEEETNK